MPTTLPSCLLLLLLGVLLPAQDAWHLQDPEQGGAMGVRAARVHADWPLDRSKPPVLVAVIDSGFELDHPGLATVWWRNPGEDGKQDGVDDDGNGLIDDLHGWNFIGRSDGSANLVHATRVVTREVARLRALATERELDEQERARLEEAEDRLAKGIEQAREHFYRQHVEGALLARAKAELTEAGIAWDDDAALAAASSDDPAVAAWLAFLRQRRGKEAAIAAEEAASCYPLTHWFDTHRDDSVDIGDDPGDLQQCHYGNHQFGDTTYHGTHVAGIIGAAAPADSSAAVPGVAAGGVRIIAIRVVPNGDERDKDVANGIRYAVDAGARIINMSFGKEYPDHKELVDAAARYARDHDVLLVQGAGNEAWDLGRGPRYPTPVMSSVAEGEEARLDNWLLVGASGPKRDQGLAAEFSNWGTEVCDLFAPGVDIVSTVPGKRYDKASGTSMASPVTAGVAALVRWQFPDLTASQVRQILIETARPVGDLQVRQPGSRKKKLPFADLAIADGVVDAWAALERARELSADPAARATP